MARGPKRAPFWGVVNTCLKRGEVGEREKGMGVM